jgi:hypothetical protein
MSAVSNRSFSPKAKDRHSPYLSLKVQHGKKETGATIHQHLQSLESPVIVTQMLRESALPL